MRKRARDRKAQQAMRDRNRWTLQYLGEQVARLSEQLAAEQQAAGRLHSRVLALESENDHLRVQNAALQLSLLGEPGGGGGTAAAATRAAASVAAVGGLSGASPAASDVSGIMGVASPSSVGGATTVTTAGSSPAASGIGPSLSMSIQHQSQQRQLSVGPHGLQLPRLVPLWEQVPNNVLPTCLSDQILQGYVERRRAAILASGKSLCVNEPTAANLCALLSKDRRSSDETSDIVGDIVRSYTEIETLPKQLAVHFIMATLFKVCLG